MDLAIVRAPGGLEPEACPLSLSGTDLFCCVVRRGGVDRSASAGFTGANVLVLGGEVGGDVFGPQFFE
jgi:hypothetical protein